MKKIILLLCLPLCATGFAGRYEQATTGEVAIPQSIQSPVVESIIRDCLLKRHWKIKRSAPGVIVARIIRRKHMAKIKITFDANKVQIHYVDSKMLGYKLRKGQVVIHKKYNVWIHNLEGDIHRMLQAEQSSPNPL